MSITSQDNIDLLRNLLKEHPLLISDPIQFQSTFQNELERLHSKRFHYKSNLMLMNKDILKTFQNIKSTMIQQSSQQREQQQRGQQREQQQREQQREQQQRGQQREQQPGQPQREIHPNKNENINLKIFEKGLKEKQTDFNNLMAKKKPKEIDFSDNPPEHPVSQSDYDYNMTQREAELAKIMQSQQQNKNVEAWLKGETNSKPSNINLKIDHNSKIKVDAIPLQKQKRVRFQEDDKAEPDFFSKLKLKDNAVPDDYKSMFKQMIDNQKLILEQLQNISIHLKPKQDSIAIRL
jgi:hypothetical protein